MHATLPASAQGMKLLYWARMGTEIVIEVIMGGKSHGERGLPGIHRALPAPTHAVDSTNRSHPNFDFTIPDHV